MNRISTIKKEYLKEEFIKQIKDNYTLEIALILLEEFEQLQQENQQLKEQLKATNKGLRKVITKRRKWKARYYKQKHRNNKAIEYINDNVAVYAFNNKDLPHWEFNDDNMKELLEILKGTNQ